MNTAPTKRKPHSDFAGYVAELRNKYSGGHTVISDCKRAAEEGTALVEDYKSEGGTRQFSAWSAAASLAKVRQIGKMSLRRTTLQRFTNVAGNI